MSNDPKTDQVLRKAGEITMNEPQNMTKLEKAKKLVGEIGPAMEKSAKEKGWEIDFDPEFEESEKTLPTPKVKLKRRARVGDSIQAEQLAKAHFGQHDPDYQVEAQHLMVAKMSNLCTFDGEVWHIPDIEKLGGDFFTHIAVKFSKFLQ